MLHKRRENRRHVADMKALRKIRIVNELGGYWSYPAFGCYRKGKIHCSCPLCAAKTRAALNKSRGPVHQAEPSAKEGRGGSAHGRRIPCTNGRYGRKNYKPSDRRKVDRLLFSEAEFAAV